MEGYSMNRQEWLIKMEKKGIANKIFMIINGKGFTPEEIAKNELLWLQVVKSI